MQLNYSAPFILQRFLDNKKEILELGVVVHVYAPTLRRQGHKDFYSKLAWDK